MLIVNIGLGGLKLLVLLRGLVEEAGHGLRWGALPLFSTEEDQAESAGRVLLWVKFVIHDELLLLAFLQRVKAFLQKH